MALCKQKRSLGSFHNNIQTKSKKNMSGTEGWKRWLEKVPLTKYNRNKEIFDIVDYDDEIKKASRIFSYLCPLSSH